MQNLALSLPSWMTLGESQGLHSCFLACGRSAVTPPHRAAAATGRDKHGKCSTLCLVHREPLQMRGPLQNTAVWWESEAPTFQWQDRAQHRPSHPPRTLTLAGKFTLLLSEEWDPLRCPRSQTFGLGRAPAAAAQPDGIQSWQGNWRQHTSRDAVISPFGGTCPWLSTLQLCHSGDPGFPRPWLNNQLFLLLLLIQGFRCLEALLTAFLCSSELPRRDYRYGRRQRHLLCS